MLDRAIPSRNSTIKVHDNTGPIPSTCPLLVSILGLGGVLHRGIEGQTRTKEKSQFVSGTSRGDTEHDTHGTRLHSPKIHSGEREGSLMSSMTRHDPHCAPNYVPRSLPLDSRIIPIGVPCGTTVEAYAQFVTARRLRDSSGGDFIGLRE